MSNERSLAGIVIILALAILGLGAFSYVQIDRYLHDKNQDELARIGQVQANQFSSWWAERQGDSAMLAADRLLARAIRDSLSVGLDAPLDRSISDRLTSYLKAYPYKSVALFAPNGQLVMNANTAGSSFTSTLRRLGAKALAEGQTQISELHVEEFSDGVQTLDIDMAVPLRLSQDGPIIAVVGLTVNTEPLLNMGFRNSPLQHDGIELILVQRNGDKVTIVNPKARSRGETLIYQRPLDTPDLPAARAARGERGIIQGTDYRGVPVTAHLIGITNSNWSIVTKQDYSDIVSYQQSTAISVAAGVIVLSLLAFMVLRHQLMRSEAEYLQAEIRGRRQQEILTQKVNATARRLQGILDNTPIGLAIIGLDRVIEQANPAFAAIYDLPAENLTGKSAEILYSSTEDFAALGKRAYPQLHAGGTFDDIVQMKRRNGSEIFVHLVARVVDMDSEQPMVVWAAEDVTQKRQVEQALRERERLYEDMFQSSAAVHLLIDPTTAQIEDCNQSACRYYGYQDETLRGQAVSTISTIPDWEIHRWLAQLCQEQTSHYQGQHRLADGTVRHVDIFANRITVNGQLRLMMIVYDITDRIENEIRIIQARDALRLQKLELEQSNSDLEQFAYVASHDLRQPLRQISSFLGLLERRFAPTLPDEAKGYVEFACKGARKMDTLIVDLLEFSRIGRQKDQMEILDLSTLLAEAMENLAVAITESHAQITLPDHLPQVNGNRGELVRLFQNLIGNALKYRAADIPCQITVSCRDQDGQTAIAIQDNGIGIAPEFHDRVFGIFQRLHAAEQYEGSGIGLAICRRIVDHHGGRITLDSQLGQGSTFTVHLPMAA